MISNHEHDAPEKFIFYHYDPSIAAAIIFAILFTGSALLHFWQIIRSRTWCFIPFLIGCLFEAVGYIGRAMSAREAPDFTKNPYIIQSILLLLGPALFAASIYMSFGRLINILEAGHLSLVKTKWLTKFFVLGDVLSFFAQGGGGGLITTAKTQAGIKRGEHIIIAGLLIQVIFFGAFIITTVSFHARIHSRPTAKSSLLAPTWKNLLHVLYGTSLLILVRSIFRVAEYVQGSTGELQSKEYYLYIFDALLMLITAALFNWFPVGQVLKARQPGKQLYGSNDYIMEAL